MDNFFNINEKSRCHIKYTVDEYGFVAATFR